MNSASRKEVVTGRWESNTWENYSLLRKKWSRHCLSKYYWCTAPKMWSYKPSAGKDYLFQKSREICISWLYIRPSCLCTGPVLLGRAVRLQAHTDCPPSMKNWPSSTISYWWCKSPACASPIDLVFILQYCASTTLNDTLTFLLSLINVTV